MHLYIDGVGAVRSLMTLLNRVRRFKPEVSSEMEPVHEHEVVIGKLLPEDQVLLTAYQLVSETIIRHQGVLCGGADVAAEDARTSVAELRFLEEWSDLLYEMLESSLQLRFAEAIAAAAVPSAAAVRSLGAVVLAELSLESGGEALFDGVPEELASSFLGEPRNGNGSLPEVLRAPRSLLS